MPTSPAINEVADAHDKETKAMSQRDRRGGFTLIEMVLALAILGLIAALGLPFSRPHTGTSTLRVKTFEIVALLRGDRNAALRFGKSSTITIDSNNGRVQSSTSGAKVMTPATMGVRLAPGVQAIVFYPDGRSSGGKLWLSSGMTTFSIEINSLTSVVKASFR